MLGGWKYLYMSTRSSINICRCLIDKNYLEYVLWFWYCSGHAYFHRQRVLKTYFVLVWILLEQVLGKFYSKSAWREETPTICVRCLWLFLLPAFSLFCKYLRFYLFKAIEGSNLLHIHIYKLFGNFCPRVFYFFFLKKTINISTRNIIFIYLWQILVHFCPENLIQKDQKHIPKGSKPPWLYNFGEFLSSLLSLFLQYGSTSMFLDLVLWVSAFQILMTSESIQVSEELSSILIKGEKEKDLWVKKYVFSRLFIQFRS